MPGEMERAADSTGEFGGKDALIRCVVPDIARFRCVDFMYLKSNKFVMFNGIYLDSDCTVSLHRVRDFGSLLWWNERCFPRLTRGHTFFCLAKKK
jgi:hypothetical protein